MCGNMSPFRYFMAAVKPISLRDPLADFLGAYQYHSALLEYSFEEVVKMTGHACPTVASAFVCCKKAIGRLHEGEIPDRGNIAVTVHAAADEGVFGVMTQVFSYITGACGPGGFKGLGGRFSRKDLLTFDPDSTPADRGSFTFSRIDNKKRVNARILPERFPTIQNQDEMAALMQKMLAGSASHDEEHRFQDLWMERVKAIVLDERDVDSWLVLRV